MKFGVLFLVSLSLFAEPSKNLGSDNWSVRQAEMNRIANGGSEVTKELLEALHSEDLEISFRARHALLKRALKSSRGTFEKILENLGGDEEFKREFREKRLSYLRKELEEAGAHIALVQFRGKTKLLVEIQDDFSGDMGFLAEIVEFHAGMFRVHYRKITPQVVNAIYRSDRLRVVTLFDVGLTFEEAECLFEKDNLASMLLDEPGVQFMRSRSEKKGTRDTVYLRKRFSGGLDDVLTDNVYDLRITGYSLSSSEIDRIKELPGLRFLRLEGTGLSEAAFKDLREELKRPAMTFRRGGFVGYAPLHYVDTEVRIIDILPNSPASKAGIEVGDVITHLNGKKISVGNLKKAILERAPGSKVKLTISKLGKTQIKEVILGTVTGGREQWGFR